MSVRHGSSTVTSSTTIATMRKTSLRTRDAILSLAGLLTPYFFMRLRMVAAFAFTRSRTGLLSTMMAKDTPPSIENR